MTALQEIRTHLNPGQVYRRSDIEKWSNAVDHHLSQLQEEKTLLKLSGGMYYCPKASPFGPVPPSDDELVKAFLKDERFLLMAPNAYNSLGLEPLSSIMKLSYTIINDMVSFNWENAPFGLS